VKLRVSQVELGCEFEWLAVEELLYALFDNRGIEFQDPLNIWLRAADADRRVKSPGLDQNGPGSILNSMNTSLGPKFLLYRDSAKDMDQMRVNIKICANVLRLGEMFFKDQPFPIRVAGT
jgi:hypothetical protein